VARHRLDWAFDNIVFMGMGEALDNFDAVAQALRVITEPGGVEMAQERITVCTVGHTEGIRRLAREGFRRLNLSVSLNAGNDADRATLMPIARRVSLADVQAALVAYRPRANFVAAVNYCLLPGVNDREEDLDGIARFCAPLGRVMVHVIPYNPGSHPIARAPTEEEVVRFIEGLRVRGLPVRRRITKGRSVMAACGQLGNVSLRRSRAGVTPASC
jgi:23S rRNA (adenine2503-C2)-methyltransferase